MTSIPYQQLLEKAQAEGLPFDLCYFPKQKIKQSCSVRIAEVKDEQELSILALEIVVANSDSIRVPFVNHQQPSQTGSSIYEDGSSDFDLSVLPEGRVNNVYYRVFNYLTPLAGVDLSSDSLSMADMDLKAIVLKPNIIRKVGPPLFEGARVNSCKFSSLEESNKWLVILPSKMNEAEKSYWMKNAVLRSTTAHGDDSCK